jgi:predicted enzyme related to lactoylglutathione lyase
MNHNPVRWFEIHVQDMTRAKKFYESVFKVELERFAPVNLVISPHADRLTDPLRNTINV